MIEGRGGVGIPADDMTDLQDVGGGLKAGYDVTPRIDVFAGGQPYLAFPDEEDTAVFTPLSGGAAAAFDTAWTFPVHAGVRIKFLGVHRSAGRREGAHGADPPRRPVTGSAGRYRLGTPSSPRSSPADRPALPGDLRRLFGSTVEGNVDLLSSPEPEDPPPC